MTSTTRAAPATTAEALPSWVERIGGLAGDPCPPAPLVLSAEMCLPPGSRTEGAFHVIGDVLAIAPEVSVAHRAAALALVVRRRHGVVVRASAAWVWTGASSVRPSRVDLADPVPAPRLPGPTPAAYRSLPVRRTRWTEGATWGLVSGVGVTDPTTTAAQCARFLPAAAARRCVEALVDVAGVDPREVVRLLSSSAAPGSRSRPGTAEALDLARSYVGT